MSNDKRGSPPLDNHGVAKMVDETDTSSKLQNEISENIVPPFKFTKHITTDNIDNVDTDIIDMNPFQQVKKDSLIKALIYLLKNAKIVPPTDNMRDTCDIGCQCLSPSESRGTETDAAVLSSDTKQTCSQVDQLNILLKNFQTNLLKSVDEKLSAVDNKLSNAISNINNADNFKSFSEVAAKTAKNVESIKSTVNNVETVTKQSIDIIN